MNLELRFELEDNSANLLLLISLIWGAKLTKKIDKKKCGIIMPISACGDCTEDHWADVLTIIKDVASEYYETRLVSETFESSLIQKEIIQNIYTDDVIICDISERNPNVMFELGLRMATQKPLLIIKDDLTRYPFDITPNRYLEYPRDLRYGKIEKFKGELQTRLQSVIKEKEEHSFIGTLGTFNVPEPKQNSVPIDSAMLELFSQLNAKVDRLARRSPPLPRTPDFSVKQNGYKLDFCIRNLNLDRVEQIARVLKESDLSERIEFSPRGNEHNHINVYANELMHSQIIDAFEEEFRRHCHY